MVIPRDFGSRCVATLVTLSVALVILTGATPIAAQGCIEGLSTLIFDTSSNCSAQPEIDRVFGTQIVHFNGEDHLVVNIGNELKIWNISNPYDPKVRDESFFNMGNVGDSDYDLLNFTVCENCRFGLAAYKRGTVVFDLGIGSNPDFDTKEKYLEATTVPGGLVFHHGTKDYLIATDLPDECASGSTLYEITGVTAAGLNRIGCVQSPDVVATGIVGGDYYDGYVYAVDRSTRVFLFKVESYGAAISLTYISTPMIAQISQGAGFALDEERGVAVTANNDRIKIYDLADPALPLMKSTANGVFTRAAVRGSFAYAGRQGSLSYDMTFDISNLSQPQQVDPDFWDRSNPFHNPTGSTCVSLRSAVFSPDSNVLYLARYSKLQMVDMAVCGGGVAPTAGISVTPSSVFPGDSVTIQEQSPGSPPRWMIWVTSTEDPHSADGWVAGQTSFSGQNSTSVSFAVDRDVMASEQFWAHVAVESDNFPYSYSGLTPNQIATRAIGIDRTPQVLGLSFDPSAPTTGNPEVSDPVRFTPEVEGNPFSATQAPTYEWEITSPQGEPMMFEGSPVDVELDESGTWAVSLTVHYEHEREGAVVGADDVEYYSDSFMTSLTITSVSADFSYAPSAPVNTEALSFTSTSTIGDGATPSYQWTISGPTSYDCPSGPSASSCQIPAETLDDGDYDVTLRVTNTANGDWSEKTVENIHVADGHIQFDFTWSPTDPEIGGTITFDMTGVTGVIDSAIWDFGGGTCASNGFYSPYYCDPEGDYFGCKKAGYQYSSGGNKTVSLTIWVAGQMHGPVAKNVVVANTGACDNGGCSFSLDPTNASFPNEGGNGSITVSATSGCMWSASTDDDWIHITQGSPVSGSGEVQYTVADNTGGGARTGYLNVAEQVTRIDQSALAQDFSWDPTTPEIGETTAFDITGMGSVDWARWSFDEPGCSGFPQEYTCTPIVTDCLAYGHQFASGGVKQVSLTVQVSGSTVGPISKTVTVLGTGSCSGGIEPGPDGWIKVNAWGIEDAGNTAATSMAVHGGALYLGTLNQTSGCQIWRATTGFDWSRVVEAGFGSSSNAAVSSLISMGDQLFASTSNTETGTQLWRTNDGLVWSQAGSNGFGDAFNEDAPAMLVHGGDLYVGTAHPSTGAEVWRTATGSSWEQVNTDGFGSSPHETVTSMAGFNGELYAASTAFWGFRLWERQLGTAWLQVGSDGFGNNSNVRADAAVVFGDSLYVGTENDTDGAQLWSSSDSAVWSPRTTDGFGVSANNEAIQVLVEHDSRLYAGVKNMLTGAEIWSSPDGTQWTNSATAGLGDPDNVRIPSAAVFNGALYVGTENDFGFQVWRLGIFGEIFSDGFESGTLSQWSATAGE